MHGRASAKPTTSSMNNQFLVDSIQEYIINVNNPKISDVSFTVGALASLVILSDSVVQRTGRGQPDAARGISLIEDATTGLVGT